MTAETSFADEAAAEMLKTLQSWWEIPSMAQYISLFRESFNLPEIEIEELEKGFIDDTIRGPSTWLQKLIFAFLKSIMPGRVNTENWEEQLQKLVRRKLAVGDPNPLEEGKAFHELKIRNKVEIVYSLCLYRLDRNDIADLMKSMDADALRVQKLGNDDDGNTYWYFYGTRLYKEENTEKKKSWDEEWQDTKKNTARKRGRGRPRKRVPTSDGESDFENSDSKKNDEYMNVSEKSRWSVVCNTIEEWVNLAEKFKTSKSKNEANLFTIIQENFLPSLNKIYEEKEKKLQQKIKELMPLPKREKIVTRREGRRLRGEITEEHSVNGHYNDDAYKMHTAKDRARRLEERNKRASEVDVIQVPSRSRKIKDYNTNNSFEQQDGDDFNLSILSRSESNDIDWSCQMKKLLSSIKLHKDAWPFLYPVNEDDAPGYYEIIQEPIDLSTIESRLYQGQYDSLQDLNDDFSKMVSNCKLYNGDYHPYSKMVKALKRMFLDGVSKILESMKANSPEPEGSSDSQYNSSSNSASSPSEPRASSPGRRKKSKDRKRRKRKYGGALDLLDEATNQSVQNTNNNDRINVTNMYDEQKNSNDFPSLKIVPIHSHPSTFIEKLSSIASQGSSSIASQGSSSIASQGSSGEHDTGFESSPSYLNQEENMDDQYIRTSPTNSTGSHDSTNYLNNLVQLTNYIEKNGIRNFNLLSNSDISDGESHHSNTNSGNDPSSFPKRNMSADNQDIDILDVYNENFISRLIKEPAYNSDGQTMSEGKHNNSSSYDESLPTQDTTSSKNLRKSPQSSDSPNHPPASNLPIMQDNIGLQSNLGSPSNLTTVDASVLGIPYNPYPKRTEHSISHTSQSQESLVSNETTVPNLVHGALSSKSSHEKPLSRTSPNELNQFYEPSSYGQPMKISSAPYHPPISLSNSIPNVALQVPTTYSYVNMPKTFSQTFPTSSMVNMPLQVPVNTNSFNMPKTYAETFSTSSTANVPVQVPAYSYINVPKTYPQTFTTSSAGSMPLQAAVTNSFINMPKTDAQTFSMNSTSNMPLQVPATYPKSVQQSRIQMQPQNDPSTLSFAQPNNQMMYFPEMHRGPPMMNHMYSQQKPNQNVLGEHVSYLPHGSLYATQIAPNVEKRKISNQDSFVNRTSPPQKKSPIPQQVQPVQQHVPSSSMPFNDATSTSSSITKTTLPVTCSNFVPMNNNIIPKPKKDRPTLIRVKLAELEKRKSPVENAAPTTSISVVSSTNANAINSVPQNSVKNAYQPVSAKAVPVVFPGYNPASSAGQNDLRFKNNPPATMTMQSNVCMSNGMPVMQQVLIPASPQQIQVPANGQIVFAQPQNTIRLFNKEQNVQILNNVGQVRQVSQGFGKVIPQYIAPGQVMQVSKDMMPGLQYQTVSENNSQTFAQVTQNPQFVSIPTYMIANQSDPSQQTMMNLQPYQLPQRQMQINGQGN